MPALKINHQGEAVVYSDGFRQLLAAKAKANTLGDISKLPPIPNQFLQEARDENSQDVESSIDGIVAEINAAPAPAQADTTSSGERCARPMPETTGRVGHKYKNILAAAYNSKDPEVTEQYLQTAEKLLGIDFNQHGVSKFGESKNLMYLASCYHGFMSYFHPKLSPDEYWREDIIKKNAELFLFNLVQCTRGRDGGPIRSSTLIGWVSLFVRLIGRHAYEGDEHKAVGSKLLASGFYIILDARRKWLVATMKLNKQAPPQGYIGPQDLAAIFEAGFASTEEQGRESFVQTQFLIDICYFTGLRSGSMASGNPKFKELGLFMRLRHVTITVAGPALWNVKLAVPYRKGYNELDNLGRPMEFFLEHVTKAHNLIFDVGTFLVASLWLRDAFESEDTIPGLCAYAGSHLVIKKEKLDEPLILARGARGHELILEPATSSNIVASINNMAQLAGLPFADVHSIRRYSGNIWGFVWGGESARRLMGHAEGSTTFDQHYSKNSLNYDLVPAGLGELDDLASATNRMALMRSRKECMILDVLINQQVTEDVEEGGKSVKLTPAQQRQLKSDPFMVMFDEKATQMWDEIHSILGRDIAIQYERHNNTIKYIRQKVEKRPVYQENKDKIEKLFERLLAIGRQRAERSRAITKRLRYIKHSKRQQDYDEKKQDHTLAQLAEAQSKLDAPSAALEEKLPEEGTLDSYSERFYGMTSPDFHREATDPKFGGGLLTNDAVAELRSRDLPRFLSEYAKKYLDDPEETGFYFASEDRAEDLALDSTETLPSDATETSSDADELFQSDKLPIFSDKDEMTVVSVNMPKLKELFLFRLTAPVTRYRHEKLMYEANGQKYICTLCIAWKHTKLDGVKGEYTSVANFKRHQEDVHTPWADLRCLMLTASTTEFKCPSPQCSYIGETVVDVYDHCTSDDCPDKRLFTQMKRACKKQTLGQSKNFVAMQRKRARALMDGIKMAQDSPATFKLLAEAGDDIILSMAKDARVKDQDLKARIPLIREMVRLGSTMIKDDQIVDKNALEPLEDIYQDMVNDLDHEWVQGQLDAITDEEALKSLGLLDDMIEQLNVSDLSCTDDSDKE